MVKWCKPPPGVGRSRALWGSGPHVQNSSFSPFSSVTPFDDKKKKKTKTKKRKEKETEKEKETRKKKKKTRKKKEKTRKKKKKHSRLSSARVSFLRSVPP